MFNQIIELEFNCNVINIININDNIFLFKTATLNLASYVKNQYNNRLNQNNTNSL